MTKKGVLTRKLCQKMSKIRPKHPQKGCQSPPFSQKTFTKQAFYAKITV
jgi:hypothetical protein